MNTHNIFRFIDKAIIKTKANELSWKTLSPNFDVKPIPEDRTNLYNQAGYQLLKRFSYSSDYKTGEILLLVFANPASSYFFTPAPPSNCTLELRIQDSKSPYATEVSNTSDDMSNAPSLMRLYNLVEKSSSVTALIDDFLNS